MPEQKKIFNSRRKILGKFRGSCEEANLFFKLYKSLLNYPVRSPSVDDHLQKTSVCVLVGESSSLNQARTSSSS